MMLTINFLYYHELRQRNAIAMNRRVRWTQNPANLEDFTPEGLDVAGPLGFQQPPLADVKSLAVTDTAKTPSPKPGIRKEDDDEG